MTIEERAARAVELKASCNCAQAVVLSYADKLPLEEETLKKLAAGYGGGMGCMEGTCGALVGAVPWFLTSTFADFFVGWLGFLVGVAACWGYRLFKGRRSTRFAMATVIVCSLLALFAAEIASWMYVLCSDPEWQADAAWYGIPVAQLAWESILMPENWGIMAPSMLMGMVSWALTICIFVIVYGRMIEIYLVTSIAPIPMATMMNREWGQMGQNYLRSLFALGFQAVLIVVCVAIYAVLVRTISAEADVVKAIWTCMGYTVLLCFCLFKTSSLSRSVFNAH